MLRLLLIDDSPDDRALVIHELKREYPELVVEAVIDAPSFEQALNIGSFDIAIADYCLHWSDGLSVVRAIKSRYPNCPAIMFTDSGNEEIAVEAMKTGLDDYITKSPKHYVRLSVAVRLALQRTQNTIRLKQAEAALQESNDRFRLLVENVRDYAIFTLDPNGYITSWNPGVERILGYQEAEIVGQHGSCIFTPEDRKRGEDKKELQTALIEGRAVDERWHMRKDGSYFWASGIVTPLRDEAGFLLGFSKIMRDFTERKQVEQALSRALNEQQSIMEAIPDIVFVLDHNGNLLKWNKRLESVTGHGPEMLQGKSALEFFPQEETATIGSAIQKVLEKGKGEVEGHLITANASFIPYDWRGVILKDAVGNVVGITGIGRDISERKQAEQALQQLNLNLEHQVQQHTAELQQALKFAAMLKRITDKVRDSLDESQILQAAVEELVAVLGVSCCNTALYDLEKGTSTICYEYAISNPRAQKRVIQIAAFPDVYEQLKQGQYCQFCSITPNPVRGRVAMLACPIFDDRGVMGDLWLIDCPHHAFNELELRLVQQVASQCAIAIRQARLYQAATAQVKELEKLNRLKDDFLNTVSHELRTPLATIKIAIRMLEVNLRQTGILDTEPRRAAQYLQILRDECQREISLVDDLLDLSRLEAGNGILSLTTLDLATWIPPIVNSFAERTRSQQQSLEINISSNLPKLTTDFSELERILTELLHNACKYTPAGEMILVTARAESDKLRLQVSNSGVEIPASELFRIFDKFYRIPNSDPWKHGGTGLGLALVKKLVEHLGGIIKATSGEGWTTFTLELPLTPDLVS